MKTHHLQTHGLTDSPEYRAWRGMRERCGNARHHAYARYGGRGIRICDRWSKFENFYADMGPRLSARHSLDRYPDNNGNYEPGNCRWATRTEQERNKRSNHVVTAFGESKSIAAWSDDPRCVVTDRRLQARLALGWDSERAMTQPHRHYRGHTIEFVDKMEGVTPCT